MALRVGDLSDRLVEYVICGGHARVAGWLDEGALSALTLLSHAQREKGVAGSAIEIGVHHGRLFVALCLLRGPGERALAIDVFEEQHLNVDQSGMGCRASLVANLEHYAGSLEGVAILQADSLRVRSETLLAECGGQRARLFSVDGGHTAQHAENDLRLAAETLADGGLIVLDDFLHDAWPGVRAGCDAFFEGPTARELAPVAVGDNKLYLSQRQHQRDYQSVLRESLPPSAFRQDMALYDSDCPHLQAPPLEALLEVRALRERLAAPPGGRISLAAGAPVRCRLRGGWSIPEEWGVWSDGARSELDLPLPEVPAGAADEEATALELALVLHPYLAGAHRRLGVELRSDGRSLGSWTLRSEEVQELRVAVPRGRSRDALWLPLELRFDTPTSPAALGLSADPRELGIGLQAIELTVAAAKR